MLLLTFQLVCCLGTGYKSSSSCRTLSSLPQSRFQSYFSILLNEWKLQPYVDIWLHFVFYNKTFKCFKANCFLFALQFAYEWLGCWQFQHRNVLVDVFADSLRLTELLDESFAALARGLVLTGSLARTYANSGSNTQNGFDDARFFCRGAVNSSTFLHNLINSGTVTT
jgi:hypothetical protein